MPILVGEDRSDDSRHAIAPGSLARLEVEAERSHDSLLQEMRVSKKMREFQRSLDGMSETLRKIRMNW